VKGVGGYLLVCAANNDAAVRALRSSKHRPTKPLALMVANVTQVEQLCELCADEAAALSGPEAPIVLLRALPTAPVSSDVAPGNPWLGVMLPSSPLHHLLMDAFGGPLVATSGNRSDEPICIDERDALRRLAGIADFHLVHDRPIERHVDDSILARIDGSLRVLRRARGYAPLPLTLPSAVPTVLAVGAHLKNTIALSVGRDVFISQHIGDLETPEAQAAFERVIRDFLQFHDAQPLAIAHDLHPDIASTHWAQSAVSLPPLANGAGPIRRIAVQHHHAHLAACLAENGIEGPALGVIWDGTGYGTDGTIWGGEFMLGDASAYTRIAHLRPFALPGGEAAVREPRRSALALLHAVGAAHAATTLFSATELRTLMRMLDTGFRSPITTSAGRVFDGMAALLGLCTHAEFEGQAAMALEFAVDAGVRDAYPLPLRHGVLDWEDALRAALYDRQHEVPVGTIAARLHNALVDGAVAVARNVGQARVALSGGCFQNRLLTQRLATKLRSQGFDVLLHRRVPTNDGGISFGQIAVAAAVIARGGS
jgi:hydrogenase maturation protein HypF